MKAIKKISGRKLKMRQKKQLAFLTIVILIASLIAIILLTPVFDVQDFRIIGNDVVTSEEIIRAGGIGTGVNILNVDTDAAEENIKSLPYIKSVEIEREFPGTLKITVVEEVGVAYLVSKEGYVIISPEGKCIDVTDGLSSKEGSTVAEAPRLPIIKGIDDIEYSKGKVIESKDSLKVKALTQCLKEFLRKGFVFDMKEIDMSDVNDIRFYYKGKDLCVSVGNIENIDYKMDCFKPFYDWVLEEKTPDGQLPKGFIDLQRQTYRENVESAVEKRARIAMEKGEATAESDEKTE